MFAGTIAMIELRDSGSSGAERNKPMSFSPEHHTIRIRVFFGALLLAQVIDYLLR